MNTEQKIAWFILGFYAYLLLVNRVLKALLVPRFGDVVVVITVIGSMVLFFVGFLTIMFFGRRKGGARVESDERDKILSLKATFAGAMVSYLAVFLFCAFTQRELKGLGVETISVESATHILNRLMGVVGFAFFGARSIAVLVLYGPK